MTFPERLLPAFLSSHFFLVRRSNTPCPPRGIFLCRDSPGHPSCLVTDVMPPALDVQQVLISFPFPRPAHSVPPSRKWGQ